MLLGRQSKGMSSLIQLKALNETLQMLILAIQQGIAGFGGAQIVPIGKSKVKVCSVRREKTDEE